MTVYEALILALTFGLFLIGLLGLVIVIVKNTKK
ncbi:MAG: putative holin-like toxin [Clostridiales bacterium]|nr:putative holin-like toxin [Clostridiales bacterium]